MKMSESTGFMFSAGGHELKANNVNHSLPPTGVIKALSHFVQI